jgi:cyanophycinase
MKKLAVLFLVLCCIFSTSFQSEEKGGKLLIIGGGYRPDPMINLMIKESGIDKGGYGIILPMSSELPDTEIVDHQNDYFKMGIKNVYGLKFEKGEPYNKAKIDSILNAKMIFISGGDQSRFMDYISGTKIEEAIHKAFENGSLICGTSAGAAVMSKKMITGNELKYPDDSGNFFTMEADNVEVKTGLGMLDKVIIDQHFLKRKRLNRLISVCSQNPKNICVGIDESTAIFVDGDKATVVGVSQVVVLHPSTIPAKIENGLLGVRDIQLDVYLPGESFSIK